MQEQRQSFSNLKAVCQGFGCNGKYVMNRQGVEKNVSIQTKNCPDCGHTLLWHDGKNRKMKPKKVRDGNRNFLLI